MWSASIRTNIFEELFPSPLPRNSSDAIGRWFEVLSEEFADYHTSPRSDDGIPFCDVDSVDSPERRKDSLLSSIPSGEEKYLLRTARSAWLPLSFLSRERSLRVSRFTDPSSF